MEIVITRSSKDIFLESFDEDEGQLDLFSISFVESF